MNDPSIRNPAYLSLTDQQLSEIDALCDRFDQELVQGDGPRIESFLAEAPEAAREGLLAELLAMEIEYRSEQGDAPQQGEYIPRFPEQRSLITGVFSREATAEFPGNERTATPAIVPTEVGNFRLIEQIGQGGMGIVLKAHDKKLKRDVAIKVLAPHLAADAAAVQRFLREAQSAAAVRHDNVVAIHAVEEANGSPFLVMELIKGESLQDRIKRGPLPADEIVQFGIQIASGLDAAHRRGLIHRDIKPANILLESQNEPGEPNVVRVKITDFGLARVMSESALTRSGFIAGTPQYMSPEQANGKPLDHRSDLFSLGSVLYSLCTGQVAFHAESAIAVLRRVTDHEPGPIRSLNPAIPAWLCEVIAKLMAKQPEDRIQSAKEVADLLTRCQAPNRERRDGPTTARLPASSIASQGSSRGPVTAKLKGTLIAVALLAGVVLAVVFSRGRNPRPTGLDLTATNPSERPQAEGVSPDAAKVPPRAIAPFNAEKAQQHQEAWAAHLKLPIEFTNSIGMKFRLIPPGEFLMGSTPEEIEAALKEVGEVKHWQECIQSEAPQHKVILTQPIYLGVNEVTQAEYEKVMGVNPSYFAPMGMGKEAVAGQETAQHPVEMVSWNDAVEFCAKLSKQENLKPFYFRAGETITPLAGTGYHLPSEAAWEFACRAGTATKFWIGDKDGDLARAGWFGENSGGRTHAAGELTTNPFGLSDIHGNVWEWVQDGWDATYYGQFPDKTAINPGVPFHAGSRRLIRGGDWTYAAFNCRSSHRYTYDYNSSYRSDRIGFRVSLVVDAVKQSREKQPAASAPVEARSRHGWPAGSPAPAIAPFNAEQAQQHQEAWAAHLKLPIEFTNSIGMKFRLIPPGEFLMGSTSEDIEAELKRPGLQGHLQFWRKHIESEGPQHKVVLTKPIYVGVTEVTQVQYEQVMGTTPSQFSPTGQGKDAVANLETGNYPVEMVSCNESAEFCAKLSQQDKLKPFNFRSDQTMMSLEGTGYRLPTEAEWEFFCRAGTTTRFWSGDENEDLIRAGWCFSNAGGRTHAASELKSNPFGLSDLHGNVWEWVQDGWDPKFYGQFQENVATNPFSPLSASSMPMRRGGSLMQVPELVRSSSRLCYPTNAEAGFRVVLFADAVKELLGKTEAEIKG